MERRVDCNIFWKHGFADLALKSTQIVGGYSLILIKNHPILEPFFETLDMHKTTASFAETWSNDLIFISKFVAKANSAGTLYRHIMFLSICEPIEIWRKDILNEGNFVDFPAKLDHIS